MDLNVPRQRINVDPVAAFLYDVLERNEDEWSLQGAFVFTRFPIYKDIDGDLVRAEFLLVSRVHGLVAFGLIGDDGRNLRQECQREDADLDRLVSSLFSRLIRNKALRESKTSLRVGLQYCIFAPFVSVEDVNAPAEVDTPILKTEHDIFQFLSEHEQQDNLGDALFNEIIATIDGSKALLRQKERKEVEHTAHSKGGAASKLEAELALFDKRQREGYSVPTEGPQRIRGLAGSGKTVVLAMKAAQTHLQHRDATILFTFYTRSLYQHVRQLITRFYRQFDDKDPDWEKVIVAHAWGGQNMPGVYSMTCRAHGLEPMTFSEAQRAWRNQTKPYFELVCDDLLHKADIRPLFDYVFIDEGQDFSANFINLCRLLAKKEQIVWAYDELQNIFNVHTPTQEEVFGTDDKGRPLATIKDDLVLHKCYRNPREIIVAAHAMGFGLYGDHIVQMLENKGHWEDIGYKVTKGAFTPNSMIEIERPQENSPVSISGDYDIDEIMRCESFRDLSQEIAWVAKGIEDDLADGLRPDDILIICVDDRNINVYVRGMTQALAECHPPVACVDTQKDRLNILEFRQQDRITISTVHKAKGNEAHMVYIMGVDALFHVPNVVNRNRLFTAMTRAKAWLRITGMKPYADLCKKEIESAIKNAPFLRFRYPDRKAIYIMKRDLSDAAVEKQEMERLLDHVMQNMSPEEIRAYVTKTTRSHEKKL